MLTVPAREGSLGRASATEEALPGLQHSSAQVQRSLPSALEHEQRSRAVRGDALEHVVLLLMENRPFDHFYGFAQPELKGKIDGLTGASLGNLGDRIALRRCVEAAQHSQHLPIPIVVVVGLH